MLLTFDNYRVEIQFGPEMLEGLIILFLDILRQKIRPDIEAIRIYKCEKFSYPNLGSFPTKWDNTVYERNRAIITQVNTMHLIAVSCCFNIIYIFILIIEIIGFNLVD